MPQPAIYLTTCDNEETADKISAELVENNLAACVNVVSPVKSTYRWEGKLNVTKEWLLVIKSVREHHDTIYEQIRKLSGYVLPELIAVDITGGSPEYLEWLIKET